ncbi:Fic family protein [Rhodococcus sp. WB9]|uniref:Fic family protein n=1 Tax=Rhodococcus sp. WB9 TaxID=2594007 RepID=UPI0037C9AE2B
MIVFANHVDVPVIAQIAVAHAQFETIHPCLDGNGRVGRALIQAMPRGGQLTRSVAVPVSAGLLHDTAEYCDALGEYRSGNVEPIVRSIAEASFGAVANGRTLVEDLEAVRADNKLVISTRSRSTAWSTPGYSPSSPTGDGTGSGRPRTWSRCWTSSPPAPNAADTDCSDPRRVPSNDPPAET